MGIKIMEEQMIQKIISEHLTLNQLQCFVEQMILKENNCLEVIQRSVPDLGTNETTIYILKPTLKPACSLFKDPQR